jgi:hypothetical protein
MPPVVSTVARTDPRVVAFCTPSGPEVFTGVVHGNQIWTADPFDVETIHGEAREVYARLLNRASSPELPAHGKTLLLLGEAGSGKTHLMRAFRAAAHAAGAGYCGYLQMTTGTDNYARYLLSNLIDSLEHPYKPGLPETGLGRLARGLLDALEMVPAEDRQRLCDDLLEPDEVAREVHRFAYLAIQHPRFRGADLDVVRALLFTLANDARVHSLALKWLRCEDLGKFDRELLGDLVPRPQPEKPLQTVLALGRLTSAVHTAALVLLVDQIEQVIDLDRYAEDRGAQFRSAVNTLVDVADGLPNAVVVVGCLEDMFKEGRQYLPNPKLDRLERNPDPIRLPGNRTAADIESVIARRLDVLFDAAGVEPDPSNPVAPYSAADLAPLAGMRGRDALDNLRRHREQCFKAGTWIPPEWGASPPPPPPPPVEWEQRWSDHLAGYAAPVLDDEPKLAELLAFAIRAVSDEMPNGVHFGAQPEGRFVPVDVHTAGDAVDRLYVAVCDKSSRGGGLGKQVEEVVKRAGEIPAVLVRSTAFPNTPTAAVSKLIAGLVAPRGKGRRVVVENSDWRAMVAFREFHGRHHKEPGFADWQRSERPLAELRAVAAILALDKLLVAEAAAPAPLPPPPPAGTPKPTLPAPQAAATAPLADHAVRLGETRGAVPAPVELRPKDLCRHAAFLGGPGSGKTTAALTVIEQLLLAGVPAVLLDRKGDLSRYADPAAWTAAEPDPDRADRRDRLRAAVEVALYTPGADAGRPLAIPVVPGDLGQLPAADREQLAQYAAASLGAMMGYRSKAPDPKLVILQKAIEVLARLPGREVTAKALQQLVADQDDALLCQVEGFEDKHFKKLSQDLLTLSLQHRRLLESGEPLNVDTLLGRDSGTGKTRLTVINTQFLGDAATTDFWVAQLLLAVDRWRAKNPSPDGRLQAVFLFDEADQYLPAVRQPAAKGPMESLLKRARSAGIGLFLATQSPGDFDYRCRDQVLTWLIGRVKEPVAIGKLRPMLEARPDAADKLPNQTAGQFFLVRESDVLPVSVERNLIPTEQLPEHRILALAESRAPVGRSAVATRSAGNPAAPRGSGSS